jgi:hypothetical protein
MFQSRAMGLATAGAMLLTRGSGAAAGKIIGSQVNQTKTAYTTSAVNSGSGITVRRA